MDPNLARLIAAREALGISRREMALRLMTPRQTYDQWENGERRVPGVAVIAAEYRAFGRPKQPRQRKTPSRDKVAALADGTRSLRDIADAAQISVRTAMKYITTLRGEGVDVRLKRASRAEAAERQQRLLAACDGKLTIRDLATLLSVTEMTVRADLNRLRRIGHSPITGDTGKGRPPTGSRSQDRILAALRDGRKPADIAEWLGVSQQFVYRVARGAGLTRSRKTA